ncbi:MAG: histidine kinase [Holophagales bacterium]|nr:histidine kinase [Holophagales bacterium]
MPTAASSSIAHPVLGSTDPVAETRVFAWSGGWASALRSFLVFFGLSFVLAWRNIWVLGLMSKPSEWLALHLREMCLWLSWWALLPVIGWAARRYPLMSTPVPGQWRLVPQHLWVHLALAVSLGGASLLLVLTVDGTFLDIPGRQGPWQDWLPRAWLASLANPILYYAMVSAYCHATLASGRARALELRAASLRASLSEAQLDALRSRLEPHFLFNTLNAISALVGRDPPRARRAMVRLSDLLRDVLSTDARHEVSLEQELGDARRYLELLALRFGDRLRLEIEVPRELLSLQVPRLILQPLLENAVRHGVEKKRDAGHLRIRGYRSTDHQQASRRPVERLHLEVIDDGPGPAAEIYEGEGLGVTRVRLEALYGAEALLELRRGATGGAVAHLFLPAVTAREREV